MPIAKLLRGLGRLLGDRRGAAIVYIGAAIVPLIGFVGMATDVSRGYLLKSHLAQALDSAGLAGGQVLHDSAQATADAQKYFDANLPSDYLGASVTGPSLSIDDTAETITLTASATIDTTFMRVLGFETLTVSASTEITRETQAMDVVLAIDMSGSMGTWSNGETRIESARAAAIELVDILFGNAETKDLLTIGLVPWNAKVNVMRNGEAYTGVTSQVVSTFVNPKTGASQSELFYANNSVVPLLEEPDADWPGCVFARYLDDGDDTNDADVVEGYLSTVDGDWNGWSHIADWYGEPQSGGSCWIGEHNPDGTERDDDGECTPCLDHGITPLQSSKSTITDAINELQNPRGFTNIPQGLAWAWRVVTPDEPFTEAVADPDVERVQAIVLLTDGENCGGFGDAYDNPDTFGGCSGARDEMNARLTTLATNIKQDGVIIYAIQFGNNSTDLTTLMQSVASGTSAPYYHYAPDSDALSSVFREVANNLSSLRISK